MRELTEGERKAYERGMLKGMWVMLNTAAVALVGTAIIVGIAMRAAP